MLEIKNLTKSYGDKPVIDIADFSLESGIYWLKGPNGSGKTTFLRMIAGILPFNGDILIDGISQKRSGVAYRRLVSWADAEPIYPSFICGNDLIGLYMEIRNIGQHEIDPLIDLFQARSFLSMPLGGYSSGMVKKLSLLLAFIGNPKLIVLDEPLITLDKESVAKFYELLMEYFVQKNTGFIISSHQDFLEEIIKADKKLCIENQTIQFLY